MVRLAGGCSCSSHTLSGELGPTPWTPAPTTEEQSECGAGRALSSCLQMSSAGSSAQPSSPILHRPLPFRHVGRLSLCPQGCSPPGRLGNLGSASCSGFEQGPMLTEQASPCGQGEWEKLTMKCWQWDITWREQCECGVLPTAQALGLMSKVLILLLLPRGSVSLRQGT